MGVGGYKNVYIKLLVLPGYMETAIYDVVMYFSTEMCLQTL